MDNQELHTLPIECYNIERSISAFETLQRAKNIGKIVITQPALLTEEEHILITGGLGALGTLLTRWLYEQGVAHVSILSRRKPEHTEPHIDYYQADIADKAQVNKVIKAAHKKYPLTGIFHLVGVLDDGIFAEQTPERFKKVWDAKALGALNLHEASQDIPLNHFVLFSSIASSMGSPGQTNYAAANSFLDQLAASRQQQGLPALSIQWGPWLEVGMAAKLVVEHARKGLKALKNQEGLTALNTALHSALPTIQIAAIDWNLVARRGDLTPWMRLMTKEVKAIPQGQLLALLSQTPPEKQFEVLQDTIRDLVANVIGLPASSIPNHKEFTSLGIDSLMILDLKNSLQEQIGKNQPLQITLFFEYPNVEKLTEKLWQELKLIGENNTSGEKTNIKTPGIYASITSLFKRLTSLLTDKKKSE